MQCVSNIFFNISFIFGESGRMFVCAREVQSLLTSASPQTATVSIAGDANVLETCAFVAFLFPAGPPNHATRWHCLNNMNSKFRPGVINQLVGSIHAQKVRFNTRCADGMPDNCHKNSEYLFTSCSWSSVERFMPEHESWSTMMRLHMPTIYSHYRISLQSQTKNALLVRINKCPQRHAMTTMR